jgi:hypothetical protein
MAGSFGFWAYLDRHLWFFGDDWQFLVARGLWYAPTDPRSIWYPHFEHWSTLPILLWRALFNVFHLSTYWPYLLALLITTVAVMHLLWRVCLRNAVDPWVAATAVGVLGFLGAGAEDLGWAFQVGFVGSVAFGLGALLLADRAEPSRAQLAMASISALASLMCSTVGDAMLVALAVVLFARGPGRRAVAVLALPAGSYVVWLAFVGRLGLTRPGDHVHGSTLTGVPGYLWTGLSTALGRSFNLEAAGGALLVALGAWAMWHMRPLLSARPALLALCAGAVVFYLVVALGRDSGGDVGSTAPRYIYIGMALLLPAIAFALGSFGRPATDAAPEGPAPPPGPGPARCGVVALLVATAVGGAGQAETWATARVALVQGLRTDVVATARLLGSGVTDAAGPEAAPIGYAPDLTAAVLGRLGRSDLLGGASLPPATVINARALLAVGLTSTPRFSRRFYLVSTSGVATWGGPAGCKIFAPHNSAVPGEIVLGSQGTSGGASVQLFLVPPASTVTTTIDILLAPPGAPPGTIPAPLYPPAGGAAYLDDNYPRAALVLEWATGTSLTLCGLGPRA